MVITIRVVISGELAERFQDYLEVHWPGQRVASDIIRRALREFLDRELGKS